MIFPELAGQNFGTLLGHSKHNTSHGWKQQDLLTFQK